MLLQDEDGQISDSWSISAGLDYPARRPRACLPARTAAGRPMSAPPTPRRSTPSRCSRGREGIVPAFESRPTRWPTRSSWRRAATRSRVAASSISPAAATRTWSRRRRLLGVDEHDRSATTAMFDALPRARRGRVRRLPDARRSRPRDQRGHARRAASRAAPTCSRSASPSPIRSPTDRSSRPPPSARSRPGVRHRPTASRLLEGIPRRHPDVPVGVLTYANSSLARGRDAFYRRLRRSRRRQPAGRRRAGVRSRALRPRGARRRHRAGADRRPQHAGADAGAHGRARPRLHLLCRPRRRDRRRRPRWR